MTFKHGKYWWTRIPTSRGRAVRRSLQTTVRARAEQIERMIASWRDQARWTLLDALASGELTMARAFDAYQTTGAEALTAQLVKERAAGEDLVPRVRAWIDALTARGGHRADTLTAYKRQALAVLGDGPVFASTLTKAWIRDRLANVGVTQTNRYRSALSAFCTWLVDEDLLERNPVEDVRRKAESAPRDRHLTRDETLTLLDALPAPFRALNALMSGTGMEISAALAVRYGDVDRARMSVRARGTKRRHRDRTVKFFARWRPEWERFVAHLDENPGVGDALVFPGIHRRRAYQELVDACAADGVKISDYRQHDWRHTYAVQAVRDRMPDHLIAHQLGHANTLMVQLVYGKFRVTGEDFDAWAETDFGASVVTPSDTRTTLKVEGGER